MRDFRFVACALLAVFGVTGAAGGENGSDAFLIRLEGSPEGRATFAVDLPENDRHAFDATMVKNLFAVYAGAGERLGRPMLGKHAAAGGRLKFTPRFPLEAGQVYTAVLDVAALTGRADAAAVRREFRIPAAPQTEPTRVVEVYPTSEVVPENLLKLYLCFSAPMSRGGSYRHVKLIDEGGSEVADPFLELGEELWDDSGTRLTVLFDPGRIKRGLKPREEVGVALREGGTYTLAIDANWRDAGGRPFVDAFRRTFRVGPPDDRQPDPKQWSFEVPDAGTRDALVVRFGEPLDYGLLNRVLEIRSREGATIGGRIELGRREESWQFRPDGPWAAGNYRLVVETTLEDLAGNSIGRPFEVDEFRPIERRVTEEVVALPFEVAEAGGPPAAQVP